MVESGSQRGVVVGIDIGGSGIKGAPVDLDRGDFAADRVRIETPQPSTPDAVAAVIIMFTAGAKLVSQPSQPW